MNIGLLSDIASTIYLCDAKLQYIDFSISVD